MGVSLVYAGSVGSGFSEAQLRGIRERLDARVVEAPQCERAPSGAEHTWVEPALVVEVRYKEWTEDGLLRQATFLRIRDDKAADEVAAWHGDLEEAVGIEAGAATEEADVAPGDARSEPDAGGSDARSEPDAGGSDARSEPDAGGSDAVDGAAPTRAVHFTNLGKVFWPEDGYTKGDLIAFYESIARWILPWLRDRPVVLTRFPDGIDGKSFFQKDAPGFAPDWLRRVDIWSGQSERELSYFVLDDVESLSYVANSGSIPLHVWASRVGSLEHPDWCSLDLDPKDAPFEHVVRIALVVRALCERLDLPCFVKTTGSSGLHVLIPLGRQLTHDQARQFGEVLAGQVVRVAPDIATTQRVVSKRKGKVYVDFLQNGHGKLLVAPFSVRPVPGALVSTPLRWSEVKQGLDLRDYTIRTVPARLARMKRDPWGGLLDARPDLVRALANLLETEA